MKHILKSLAAAALLAVPSVSQAQIDNSVLVNILSHPFQTGGTGFSGNGGGFKATFTIDFGTSAKTFTDYLIWCIDSDRRASAPGSYTFAAYTAADFAMNTTFGGGNGHDVTESEMGKIVHLVDDLTLNWTSYTAGQRERRQGSVWSLFRGGPTVASLGVIPEASLDQWAVLWNGQDQTFLTYVPEPSSAALLLSGLGGMVMLVAMRRRRA